MAEVSGESQPEVSSGLSRAITVLLHLAASAEPTLGVTEIASELDLSKAVVFRILQTLKVHGLVQIDDKTRRYSLGTATLLLSEGYLRHLDLLQVARPIMQRLAAATEETVTLSVREGHTRRYVEQILPTRDVKMVVEIGRSFPLHAGASSKAILGMLDDQQQQQYFADEQKRGPGLDPRSLTALIKDLQQIRERGYAASTAERDPGASAVAAPIFGHEGVLVGSMSVSGPVTRFEEKIDSASALVVAAAAETSAALGHLPSIRKR